MATFSANTFYEYTNKIQGSFSGGTWESFIGNVPHPSMVKQSNSDPEVNDVIVQMNAVAIGGFNGLNN